MNANENSHEPLVERALVGFDLAAEHHLANCEPCQQERESVQEALRLFGAANREYASRPEAFWEQQTSRIRAASKERAQRSRVGLALVPGLAVLMLLGVALLSRKTATAPMPSPIVAVPLLQTISDQELLVEVERAMQSNTPLSLEPATLMVEESENSMPVSSVNGRKETHNDEN